MHIHTLYTCTHISVYTHIYIYVYSHTHKREIYTLLFSRQLFSAEC